MKLEAIKKQEEMLQFEHFSNEDAISIGLKIIELAKRAGKGVAIDISRNRVTLFHAAMDGTNGTNELWMKRKKNTIYFFENSSLNYQTETDLDNKEIIKSGLNNIEYASAGGAFPVKLKGTGFVGAVIVSGLKGAEDHDLAAHAIAEYLGIKDLPSVLD